MRKTLMTSAIVLGVTYSYGSELTSSADPDAIHPATRAAIATSVIPAGGWLVSNWAVDLTAKAIVSHQHPDFLYNITFGSWMRAGALKTAIPKAQEYGTLAGVAGTAFLLSFALDYAYPSWKRVLNSGSKPATSDDWLRVVISSASLGGGLVYFLRYQDTGR